MVILQKRFECKGGDFEMRQAKWRNYTKKELEEIVKNSKSDRDVAEALGYNKDSGSAKQTLHQMYKELNLDTSHFLGQGWNKGNYLFEDLKLGIYKKRGTLLNMLIDKRGRMCECCGSTQWLGRKINLEVHHKDGNHLNNNQDNLQLLCPNCHSYTDNWRGRIKKRRVVTDEEFVEALRNNNSIRQALLKLGLTAAGDNYSRARELMYKYNIEFN